MHEYKSAGVAVGDWYNIRVDSRIQLFEFVLDFQQKIINPRFYNDLNSKRNKLNFPSDDQINI